MANSNLTQAKRVKNDEFYTQYGDIQNELRVAIDEIVSDIEGNN